MRYSVMILALGTLTACDAASLAGPGGEQARPVAADQPSRAVSAAPGMIYCRRAFPPSGPLYVVDGRIVNDSVDRLAFSAPEFHVETLEGPAASALYGSRASAGVVLVTTKRLPAAARQR